jgi:predicted esterase
MRRQIPPLVRRLGLAAALGAALGGGAAPQVPADAAAAVAAGQRVVYRIRPSEVDAATRRFDDVHYVAFDRPAPATPLVVFMAGSGGRPENMAPIINFVADQGFRAVGVSYPTAQAVVQVCASRPDPDCSGDFRRKRIYGEGDFDLIDDAPDEAIVHRLTLLLRHLDRLHPTENWGAYLDGDAPDWSRIIVTGHSQGAGMAAYIAKREPVARVVLFSSPWDHSPGPTLAPWLQNPGATPPERWYGVYHRDENTAALLAQAYVRLGIPADHIRVLDLDSGRLTAASPAANPYHTLGIRDPRMAEDWRWLFGRGAPVAPRPAATP